MILFGCSRYPLYLMTMPTNISQTKFELMQQLDELHTLYSGYVQLLMLIYLQF